jgi:uncharacterized Zn-binding protein involved in type VI secretion
MGMPAAKMGDKVVGVDIHIVLIPAPPGPPVPTPLPSPFNGIILQNLSSNVLIMGRPAATLGSIAINTPSHIPEGGPFQVPPTNQGQIIMGSATVLINKKPAARAGDTVLNCNDPVPAPTGTVVAAGTVLIGG